MPNYTVQLRRGTAAEHSSFTGAAGEVTVNTTRNSVHVHDGSTAGGTELATKSSVDNLSSDSIIDADSDTHVKVEATSDADTIDFTVAGTTIAKMEATGLIPTVNSDGTTGFDLGSSSYQWRDVYVSSGSLYVNGSQVLSDDSGTITFSADNDQAITIKTTGTGASTIQSENAVNITTTGGSSDISITAGAQIELNSDVVLGATKTITCTGGNDLRIASPVDFRAQNLSNINSIVGDLTVTGDFTVSGTTTTINTETLTVDDNIIVLNNNATGSASQNAGIEVERGDDANKTLLWNETDDKWTVGSETFVAGTFEGTATSAQYADLAERYHAGESIEAGSVVCFGGENEIEMCAEDGCTRVAGVISTAPAYMMNRDAGDDSTHPYVALAGRVPCKVTGSIRKGDLLHSSAMAGHAMAGEFKGGAMIGKALEDFDGESGVIEVLVNLM
jgi:hypothetical protein